MSKLSVAKIAHFSGHKDAVFSLGRSLDEHRLYSGAAEGYIVEWDLITKADGKLLVQVNRPVYSFHLDEAAGLLYAGTAEGNLHVIDLASKKEIRNIEVHKLGLFDIRAAKNLIITAGGDGNVCVLEKTSLDLLYKIEASGKSARVIALHPGTGKMAVGFSDHKIRIYDLHSFELLQTIDAHSNSVFALAYSPDGSLLISGGRDAVLKSWDTHAGYISLHEIPAHTLHINQVAYSPSGKYFATVSMDKSLKIWDAATFELLKVVNKEKLEGHLSSVNKLLWLSDTMIATASDDRSVMVWGVKEEGD